MRVYCPKPLPSQSLSSLFFFRYAGDKRIEGLFKENLPPNFFQDAVSYVHSPEEAEAIILPNNFISQDDAARAYIAHHADEAERCRIPLFLFSCGDLTDSLRFDERVHVFKYSLYRSSVFSKEISTPTLTEDIGEGGITLRKKREKPIVSFCGQAGYNTNKQWIRYYIKVIFRSFVALVRPLLRARLVGVYWRRQMLAACADSPLLQTNFIIRRSFSGAQRTIELDPHRARKEFIDSVSESDFVLAPKGDGNYSNRFLEVLSMGRIPVLVDTDVVLPLEHVIDYSKVVVRVPMNRVHDTPRYIREFYNALSEEEWEKRQLLAREVFEKYLRQDSFFKTYFSSF